jgi:hypothetical protein
MSRPFEILVGNRDFREFIYDLLLQMSLDKEELQVLFDPSLNDKVMQEFAKCFVTAKADPEYNYEVYELAGDVCVNSSVVMYLHRMIQATQQVQQKINPGFLPDPKMKDYFNKLKSKYISNQQYHYFADRLGFTEFIQLHPDDKKDITEKKEVKFIPSAFEAFFGCFEFIMTKYIKNKYSHIYVANFISTLMHSHEMNYHPSTLYDSITLLKETGDQTRPPNRKGFLFEVSTNRSNPEEMIVVRKDFYEDGKDVRPHVTMMRQFGSIKPDSDPRKIGWNTAKEVKMRMCESVLKYIYDHRDELGIQTFQIKRAPTPEELGITELCKV